MTTDKTKGHAAPSASGSAQHPHLVAYALFRAEVKKTVEEEYNEKVKGRDPDKPALKKPNVTELASRKWKKLSDEEKEKWYAKV